MESVNPFITDSRDLIAHALYLGSAITDTASEPAKVIANARPIADWLAGAEDDDAAFERRLMAIYQQLNNQRGAGCEVHRFVERAELLYQYLTDHPAESDEPEPAEEPAADPRPSHPSHPSQLSHRS